MVGGHLVAVRNTSNQREAQLSKVSLLESQSGQLWTTVPQSDSKLSISAINMHLHILNCSKHWCGQVAYMFPLRHADIEPVKH